MARSIAWMGSPADSPRASAAKAFPALWCPGIFMRAVSSRPSPRRASQLFAPSRINVKSASLRSVEKVTRRGGSAHAGRPERAWRMARKNGSSAFSTTVAACEKILAFARAYSASEA